MGQFRDSFFKTLKKQGVKHSDNLILRAREFSMEDGYKALKERLTENKEKISHNFTVIVTCGDLLALGIYSNVNELRFEIPVNYSLIGYDNIKVTSELTPPLTTRHQPRKRIGQQIARILIENIENENKKTVEKIVFDPHLVIRGSVRKIN